MMLHPLGALFHQDRPFEPDWSRWQIGTVRKFVNAMPFPSSWVILDGYEEATSNLLTTSPNDYRLPDSIGLFYEDGEESEASWWSDACRNVLTILSKAVDWQTISPSQIRTLGKRAGLELNPKFSIGASYRYQEVPDEQQSREQIENAKTNQCQIHLVRQSKALRLPSKLLFERWSLSYIYCVAGSPPDGVVLCPLWEPGNGVWRDTGEPVKEVVGWGLNYSDEARLDAMEYAECWRLAYYVFATSIKWPKLCLNSIFEAGAATGAYQSTTTRRPYKRVDFT